MASSATERRANGGEANACRAYRLLLLVGLLVALAPSDYANPSSSFWIEGIFDDADDDDVASAETSKAADLGTSLTNDLVPPCPVRTRRQLDGERIPASACCPNGVRSPPLS